MPLGAVGVWFVLLHDVKMAVVNITAAIVMILFMILSFVLYFIDISFFMNLLITAAQVFSVRETLNYKSRGILNAGSFIARCENACC